MMLLSQAAKALDARMIGADVRFTAVSTDSRKVKAGDLFIALRGENFDGYDFAATAAQDGAAAVMVNADSYEANPLTHDPLSPPILLVKDTRLALGQLAAYWRAQFDIPLVAITGSNGKTTVKEMLTSILRQKIKDELHDSSLSLREITSDLAGVVCQPSRMASSSIRVGERVGEREQSGDADQHVLATHGNLNNDIGMPLTLLRLNAQHRYAVIEMGMNHSGEIDYLTHLARPDVALITNASGAHLAGLGSVEAVAHAKGEIFAGLKLRGTAVINADDAYAPLWRDLATTHPMIGFSLDQAADISGKWQPHGAGLRLDAQTPSGNFSVDLQVPGAHNARNALAATAAAIALKVPLEAIATGLEKFGGVSGRLQRKTARHGATLIDDTYNANPASMRAAIGVLAQSGVGKPGGKRVMVMGDMGELGGDAAMLHAEIGIEARTAGIEKLYALGELSANAVRAFGCGAEHFACIEDLQKALEDEMDEDTTLLVKGSRFMKMERVVEFCINEKGAGKCCSH